MSHDKFTFHVKLKANPGKLKELIKEHEDLMVHFRKQSGVEYCELLQDV